MTRPALFLDRDGTLIADTHYLADAALVQVLPFAAEGLQVARAADVPVVIVTNQSGIARGLITETQYDAVRKRTVRLLEAAGGRVLATYHCPHLPDVTGACECRKPGLGMYRQAAREHGLDLGRSAYIGDRWRDVQPAIATGGLGILVPGRETPADDVERAERESEKQLNIELSPSVLEAVTLALARLGMSDAPPRSETRATPPFHPN
jgi:histidinol-phosphate phosphatase family protein